MKLLEKPLLWRAVLAVMMAALALVGFWPSPVDAPAQGTIASVLAFLHAHGIPGWINYSLVEKAANVALFIPFGIAASLAYPDKRWWQNAALGVAVSGCMELGQLLFLHNRFSSWIDVVTNSGGSVIGALLAMAAVRTHQQKQAQRFNQR
ncbi:VanZ family protein [Pseudarthrobacter albicanus]|uniref:VanZ family protein n=1 Tax=Pseudarthrobacter albicanus TaxID=2823873 RepID=UPI001FEB3F43|nr:VanZ family protein [Pseudarthrobacter albicanus]